MVFDTNAASLCILDKNCTTKESHTVVAGPARRGRGEILVRLHCSVYQTLDGGPSAIQPLMAVAAISGWLIMRVI